MKYHNRTLRFPGRILPDVHFGGDNVAFHGPRWSVWLWFPKNDRWLWDTDAKLWKEKGLWHLGWLSVLRW